MTNIPLQQRLGSRRLMAFWIGLLLAVPFRSVANEAYVYDVLGRLSCVGYSGGGSVVYAYDALGNRIQATTQAYETTTNVNSVAAQIYRLYDINLGRAPSQAEVTVWLNYAQTTPALSGIAAQFLTVASVQVYWNGALSSNTAFVNQLYQFAFRRAPTSSESSYWLGQLNSGQTTQGGMMAILSEDPSHRAFTDPAIQANGIAYLEFTTSLTSNPAKIYRLYELMLGRAPTPDEIGVWLETMETTPQLSNIVAAFFTDPGVQAYWYPPTPLPATAPKGVVKCLTGGAEDTVCEAYYFAFGRAPTSAEESYWQGQFSSGASNLDSLVATLSEDPNHIALTSAASCGVGYDF